MVRVNTWFYIASALVLPWAATAAPVTVAPSKTSVRAGASKQFTAKLKNVTGTIVWAVNGVAGGNATLGTISEAGLYTAPPVNPGIALMIRATIGTPPVFGEASVTWLNPTPSIAALAPPAVNIGTFNVMVHGKGFVSASQVLLNGSPVQTTFGSSTALTFHTTVNDPQSIAVTVSNPDPGGASSGKRTLQVMANPSVTLGPAAPKVRLGATLKFHAGVSNAVDKSVNWSVDGIPGGSAALGTIASDGTYTAPAALPPTNQVTITAATVAQPQASAQAVATLLNPIPVIQSLAPNPLSYGAQTITVVGTGFVPGSQLKQGGTVFTTQFVSPTQLTATGTLNPTPAGLLAFKVTNPDPGGSNSKITIAAVGAANPKVSYLAAARFLEQASWGPNADSIAHVQDIGFDAWITEQLAAPISLYKSSKDSSDNLVNQQSEFFVHAMHGEDQLRQRVAFALGQIFVVSGLKTGEPRQMVPYQNMLLQDAFGTYLDILTDVTLSPTMGMYLDMVDNDKADPVAGTAPNENYGREVMQLLSIGTAMLNPDGSTQMDSMGQPIPTYTPATIGQMARALTGWTFPGPPISHGHNEERYTGPMIPVEANHDEDSKAIVGGVNLLAGQTAQQDLQTVLQTLANHPNTAPFISLRLIQHLVTSNPSPQYISDISQVFTASGGDLSQVVRAILLHPEARQGDDPNAPIQVTGGHLREPLLFVLAMMRNISAGVVNNNPIEGLAADMGQNLFYAPSIFNYYSPLFRIAGGLLGPEFQTLNSSTALVRSNVVQDLIARNLDGDIHYSLGAFTQLYSSPADMVNAIDNAFMYGRMPATLKADIVTAIKAASNAAEAARNAIYLIATSSLYQVQH
jgi:uncharacterized protein (DUF1800 family)